MMNLTLMSHSLLAILCFGVIIQTMRLMRRLRAVSDGRMGEIVAALDRATGEARTVLEGLRRTLGGEGAEVARQVGAARELSEELGVLIGIADAMADRLAGDGEKEEAPARQTLGPIAAALATRERQKPRTRRSRAEELA